MSARMRFSLSGDLRRLNRRLERMARAKIASITPKVREQLVSSTIRRFNQQRDPSGRPWAPLAASTTAPRRKDLRRDGALRASAARKAAGRKILVDTARLRNSISGRSSGTQVAVGSNVVYATIHQFGGLAGRGRKVRIPARPFIGISTDDEQYIMQQLQLLMGR